jgi:hypothetical protein
MPDVGTLKKSAFLKKEDCGPNGILVTIKSVIEENVAKDGAPEEYKWCLHLHEAEKPMVLNSTKGELIAAITGKRNTDDWPGSKIVLYNDPAITFQGKLTGGIRVRAPRGKAAQAAPPTLQPVKLPPAQVLPLVPMCFQTNL